MGRPKDIGNMSLSEQAQAILKIARRHGVEQNFFFITTFKRYQVQITILNDLEKTIKKEGLVVAKEYVKGRKNVYSHPAIKDYNRTADAANKTVTTLLKIIQSMRPTGGEDPDEEDPLMRVLAGGGLEDLPEPEDIDLEEGDDDDEDEDDAEDADASDDDTED